MSNYFKPQTVEQVISESKSLSDILINHENYYAHTPDEKLYEHTKLTNEYLTLLINANGLDLVIDKLLFKLLDTIPRTPSETGVAHLPRFSGRIDVENLWFAYNDDEWVLKDVSFSVRAGERVAIVGATGAGKTTFLHTWICSLIQHNTPAQVRLALVDLKGGIEFTRYKEIPHMMDAEMLGDEFKEGGFIKKGGDVVFPTHVGVNRCYPLRAGKTRWFSPHTWG